MCSLSDNNILQEKDFQDVTYRSNFQSCWFFFHSPWYFPYKRCQRPGLFYSGNPWVVNMLLVVLFVCRDNEWGASSFILFLRLEWGPKTLHLVEPNRIVETKESPVSLQSLGFMGDEVSHHASECLLPVFFFSIKAPGNAHKCSRMDAGAVHCSAAVGLGTLLGVWALISPLYLHSRYCIWAQHQVCCDNRTRPRAEQEIQLPCLLFTQLFWKGRVAFIPGNYNISLFRANWACCECGARTGAGLG